MPNLDLLPLVCVIEEASGLSIYQIIDESIMPWITLYHEEVSRMEDETIDNELLK